MVCLCNPPSVISRIEKWYSGNGPGYQVASVKLRSAAHGEGLLAGSIPSDPCGGGSRQTGAGRGLTDTGRVGMMLALLARPLGTVELVTATAQPAQKRRVASYGMEGLMDSPGVPGGQTASSDGEEPSHQLWLVGRASIA